MKAAPRATSAAYDAARHRIEIELQDGSAVAIPVAAIDALAHASPDQLEFAPWLMVAHSFA
jgi:hypothetical protein